MHHNVTKKIDGGEDTGDLTVVGLQISGNFKVR